MSTRGCVAVGTLDKWRGVYNHFDSYPTGLGPEVWKELHNGNTVDNVCRQILSYDDWRAYLGGGICEYCGKKTGQPHSINGMIFGDFPAEIRTKRAFLVKLKLEYPRLEPDEFKRIAQQRWKIQHNRIKTGYPDPEAKYHQHNDISKGVAKNHIRSTSPDPLFIEWVYIIEPTGMLHVLGHRGIGSDKMKALGMNTQMRKGAAKRIHAYIPEDGIKVTAFNYGHCIYWHEHAGSFDLNEPEPDWENVEQVFRGKGI